MCLFISILAAVISVANANMIVVAADDSVANQNIIVVAASVFAIDLRLGFNATVVVDVSVVAASADLP